MSDVAIFHQLPIKIQNRSDSYNASWESPFMKKSKDQDRSKGAMEQDSQNEGGNTSMQGQLGHRDQDPELKDADSDQPG